MRLLRAGLVLAVLAGLSSAVAGAQVPVYDTELLAKVREAAGDPGSGPRAVRVAVFNVFRVPASGMVEGAGQDPIDAAHAVFQIEFPDRWLMVDAGLDRAALGESAPGFDPVAYQQMVDGLLGAERIVLTHEHHDHATLAFRGDSVESIQRRTALTDLQLAWMLSTPNSPTVKLDPSHAARFQRIAYHRWHRLAPGVVLIAAPGHTPGSQLVYVRLVSGEELVLVGDVAWNHAGIAQVAHKPEPATAGFGGEMRPLVRRQLRWLQALEAEGVGLAVTHDLASLQRLIDRGLLQRGLVTRPGAR